MGTGTGKVRIFYGSDSPSRDLRLLKLIVEKTNYGLVVVSESGFEFTFIKARFAAK